MMGPTGPTLGWNQHHGLLSMGENLLLAVQVV